MTHPQQRSRTGLLAGIGSAVAVVVAAVLVTGLAWPGWMTGSIKGTAAPAAGTSPQPPSSDRGDTANTASSVAQRAVEAANRRDIDAMAGLRCTATTKEERRDALDNLTEGDVHWSIASPPKVAGDDAVVKIAVSGTKPNGEHATVTKALALKKVDGTWCMT